MTCCAPGCCMAAPNCRDWRRMCCPAAPAAARSAQPKPTPGRKRMTPDCASLRGSALAGLVAALLAGAPALAQQPAAPAAGGGAAPGARRSALYGRPGGEHAAKLAPVAPPPIPTPADKLPVAKLKV